MDSASVTWYGQAGFCLAAGDSRILIDPFLPDLCAVNAAARVVVPATAWSIPSFPPRWPRWPSTC